MHLSGALTIILALSAGPDERLLLCRPEVTGDPGQARAEAVGKAARKIRGKFLDYGAQCADVGEGARAARRAGLPHALVSKAEATADGSRYELVLADAEGDEVRGRRQLEVKLAADAVPPLKGALRDLLKTLPPKPGPDPQHVAAWTVAGLGAATVVAGIVLSARADSAESKVNDASDPAAYVSRRKRAKEKRTQSNITLGVGAAAVAGGLAWRFVF